MRKLAGLQLILWLGSGIVCGQDVIFGNSSGGSKDADACTTKDGKTGRCTVIGNCALDINFLRNPPLPCGFDGFNPIICCPTNNIKKDVIKEDPTKIQDISAPDFPPGFECGRSATKIINFRFRRASAIPSIKAEFAPRPPPFDDIFPVVGGTESLRNAWPWMALIGSKEGPRERNWFCGGALINDQWILTAGHCVDSKIPDVVRLGEHDYTTSLDGDNHKDFDILKIVRHPNYTFPVVYHDLALLQLSEKVRKQTFIAPVCLPWGEEIERNLTGKTVKLKGWGDTQFAGQPSTVLQEVDLTMFPTSKCEESYSRLRQFSLNWPNSMGGETACAGDVRGGRDACQGDSGGPITYLSPNFRYVVNGIVSTGYGCGRKDFPGIYANLQHKPHLAWIKSVAF